MNNKILKSNVMDSKDMENENSAKYSKGTYYFTMIIAGCSVLMFLVVLICALVVVPKAVRLMGTAQSTIDNMREVSEQLTTLKLSETIQSIDENTAQAMNDVSGAMNQINSLDIETLNESIESLQESVENLNTLFDR